MKPTRLWLVLYGHPIRSRLVRRVVGPFLSLETAVRSTASAPPRTSLGWRILEGVSLAGARLVDEDGLLPAERSPNPSLRDESEAALLERLASEAGFDAGLRRRMAGLTRRGLVDEAGRLTSLGHRALARYRTRGDEARY